MASFNHVEAFCIMAYECKSCHLVEKLWNSRDGVTPFIIHCERCGGEMTHINWRGDERFPDYEPHPSMRIFRTMSRETFLVNKAKYIDRYWDVDVGGGQKMSDRWKTKGDALNDLAKSYREGEPEVVVAGA